MNAATMKIVPQKIQTSNIMNAITNARSRYNALSAEDKEKYDKAQTRRSEIEYGKPIAEVLKNAEWRKCGEEMVALTS